MHEARARGRRRSPPPPSSSPPLLLPLLLTLLLLLSLLQVATSGGGGTSAPMRSVRAQPVHAEPAAPGQMHAQHTGEDDGGGDDSESAAAAAAAAAAANAVQESAARTTQKSTGAGSTIAKTTFIDENTASEPQVRAALHAARAELAGLQRQLGVVSGERDHLLQNVGALRNKLREQEQERASFRKARDNWQTEKRGLEQRLQKRKQELAPLKSSVDELQRRVDNPTLGAWARAKASHSQAMQKVGRHVVPRISSQVQTWSRRSPSWLAPQDHSGHGHSAVIAGLLTYGPVLLPAGVCIALFARISRRVPLEQYVRAGNVFFAAFSAYMSVFHVALRTDPLKSMQVLNSSNFTFVQTVLALTYPLLVLAQAYEVRRAWCARVPCTRAALRVAAATGVALDYYVYCWRPAMLDQEVDTSTFRYLMWTVLSLYTVVLSFGGWWRSRRLSSSSATRHRMLRRSEARLAYGVRDGGALSAAVDAANGDARDEVVNDDDDDGDDADADGDIESRQYSAGKRQ